MFPRRAPTWSRSNLKPGKVLVSGVETMGLEPTTPCLQSRFRRTPTDADGQKLLVSDVGVTLKDLHGRPRMFPKCSLVVLQAASPTDPGADSLASTVRPARDAGLRHEQTLPCGAPDRLSSAAERHSSSGNLDDGRRPRMVMGTRILRFTDAEDWHRLAALAVGVGLGLASVSRGLDGCDPGPSGVQHHRPSARRASGRAGTAAWGLRYALAGHPVSLRTGLCTAQWMHGLRTVVPHVRYLR